MSLSEIVQNNPENSNVVNFTRYGHKFQEKLVQLMLLDRGFCNQILEVFKLEYIDSVALRWFLTKIIEYKQQYQTHPTLNTMEIILSAELPKIKDAKLTKNVLDYFESIKDVELKEEVVDGSYIMRTALNFCKTQCVKAAFVEVIPRIESNDFDGIHKTLSDALKLGLDHDHGYEYVEDFEARYNAPDREVISTGWAPIDKVTHGGLGKKELSVVMAPTGVGKSMNLVHMATSAAVAGKTVFYFTFELADRVIGNRFDSCLTGIGLNDLKLFKDRVYEQVKALPGKIYIKEYQTRGASTRTVENFIEKMIQRGIKPDLVVVDYADIMKPVSVNKDGRTTADLQAIYEELRGIAQKFNCHVATASQTNRSGLGVDIVTLEHIAAAYDKAAICDFIFTISQRGKLFIAKNRNGPDQIAFDQVTDLSRVKIEVLEQKDEDVDLSKAMTKINNENDQMKNVKSKLEAFINGGSR